jgi:hypothetical protein
MEGHPCLMKKKLIDSSKKKPSQLNKSKSMDLLWEKNKIMEKLSLKLSRVLAISSFKINLELEISLT